MHAKDNGPGSGDLTKREILTYVRTYLEVSIIIALSTFLFYSQLQVYKLQEARVKERDENILYWRELNERSWQVRDNTRNLRQYEAELDKREAEIERREQDLKRNRSGS